MASASPPKHIIRTPKEEVQKARDDFRGIERYITKDTTVVAQQNRLLNRYLDVVPYDRFVYPSVSPATTEKNAVYINGTLIECAAEGTTVSPRFVACQAPLPAGLFAFFSALVSGKITLVMMLTSLEEGGVPKADQYWPESPKKGATLIIPSPDDPGQAWVVEQAEDEDVDTALRITRRVLRVSKKSHASGATGASSHTITQVQYTGWPDHGVPCSTDAFGYLIHEIERYDDAHSKSPLSATSEMLPGKKMSVSESSPAVTPPVVVHCSAGVGRTGTLIAAYAGVQIAKKKGRTMDTLPTLVLEMRKRRPYMVQRFEQYLYANTVILGHCGADIAAFKPEMDDAVARYNAELQERFRLMMAAQGKR